MNKTPDPNEMNICGVLVHSRQDRLKEVCKTLDTLPGVEIHGEAQNGRLVVTIEDTSDTWAGDTLAKIYTIDGVLAASLVYHQCDAAEPAQEVYS